MVLYLKSVADVLVVSKIRQAQYEIPFFTFQKMCFAYLNNDWIMVISSLFTMATAMSLFVINGSWQMLRSES